jgi:hypothetical protein
MPQNYARIYKAVQCEGYRCNSIHRCSTERREGNICMKGKGGTAGKPGLTTRAVTRSHKKYNHNKRKNDWVKKRDNIQLLRVRNLRSGLICTEMGEVLMDCDKKR